VNDAWTAAHAWATREPEAEGVGFEPTDRANPVNSFQGCRIQPLCHPSGRVRPKCDGQTGSDPGIRF
jgi:hypothetical protein